MMIIIDSGPLVALFDKDDQFHQTCEETLKKIDRQLITTWPVITEVMFLLKFSIKAQELCWSFLEMGAVEIHFQAEDSIKAIRTLMYKYRDLPMDLADATLVLLAEEKKIDIFFTLDHKDCRVYKPRHTSFFRLLPEKI